jgi:hypothetical protein
MYFSMALMHSHAVTSRPDACDAPGAVDDEAGKIVAAEVQGLVQINVCDAAAT